jgi:hypothetical protein
MWPIFCTVFPGKSENLVSFDKTIYLYLKFPDPPPGSSLQTGVPKTNVDAARQSPPYPVHHDVETNVCDDPFQREDSLLEPCGELFSKQRY